ncbi:type I phosphomannose isomerase catalytic subunit [Bacteroides sp.]|uniref:type I phosphomannose isomerase catalytic subunit n=1 Tax=Bacteroides sp. TaxID=29523 RepID=UPI001B619BD9|nr:type I phosphomannose isomerase catalytic subunit [Bacteroides sp.]MBP6064382.1 class I mannose-6-phosphate isomerase [Bacteroides sp.]MBP6067008.1 class I mannose-6-phosphate isomerase [Bacteroides sp.]MBP6936042.1 class I mannose-6-phosphate isomerase [Bacteroides sp.]MBP8622704.1 class I mannose-6-phosphate isomerase [Bacteroides sp.]MBP9507568.1 class I mannose-6-phosphate isomerase [Bacteroides sp.]
MYPLKFEPILKQTLWGGDKIVPFKHLNDSITGVGESWEISGVENNESVVANGPDKGLTLTEMVKKYREELVGEENYARFGNKFPLLIKFIDAKQDLSIQVHPDDVLAKKRHNSMGKTEMWYVVDADKGAKLRSGFSQQITPKEYKERVYNNTITDVLQEYEISPGDVFFLPAGRIHSIGAGSFIAEIQQTSDVTYRIYDFNRKDDKGNTRELHTDLAREAIDYEVLADYRTKYDAVQDEPNELVACPYFTTSIYDMTEEISCDYSELDSFVIFICIEGACKMIDDAGNEISLRAGETVLLPATTQDVTITPEDGCVKILETYV